LTMNKQNPAQRLDSVKLDQTYFTDENFLIDHPIVTSVGVFEYKNSDGSTRRELRLPEEVFAEKSLNSYRGKPIIITHDAGYVDKDNVNEAQIGTILSAGYRDGDNVKAEIVIHDTDAMKQSGLRELSLGYNLRLDDTPGEWNGEPYDAIQRDIVINHLALVSNARAGEQARLNIDARDPNTNNYLKGGKTMAKTKRKDGVMLSPEEMTAAVEAYKQRRAERMAPAADETEEPVTDTGNPVAEQIVEEVVEEITSAPTGDGDAVQMVRDRRDRRDAEGDPEDLGAAMGVIAQQDEDIDALLGVIDVLQAAAEPIADSGDEVVEDEDDNTKTDANADRKDSKDDFREMLRVVRVGDRLNMDGLESMSVKGAKKAIIKKLKPTLNLDGRSESYVNAAFDMAVNDLNNARKDTNYQRKQMTMNKDSKPADKSVGSAAEARERMIKRLKKEDK